MTVRTGTGCTLTMGTTDYDAEILSISSGGVTIPVIDTSHLGTTTARTKMMGDLRDFGEMEVEIHLDPDKLDTMDTVLGLVQTMTFTFKTVTGETAGATMAGSGAVSAHNFDIPLEDKIAGNYTVSWLGDVTFTDAT